MYKYITSISRNVYTDEQDDIVNEYNNTYHKTIQPKSVGVEDNAFIHFEVNKDSNKEVNDKDPRFQVDDHVRILKYKNILLQDILQIFRKICQVFCMFQNVPNCSVCQMERL